MNETVVKLLLERGYTRARKGRKNERKEVCKSVTDIVIRTSWKDTRTGYGNKRKR